MSVCLTHIWSNVPYISEQRHHWDDGTDSDLKRSPKVCSLNVGRNYR